VGWDDEPVTEGIFNDERTNMNAPETAMVIFISGCSENIFLIFMKPQMSTGNDIMNQNAAHSTGKNPSIMCMRLFPPTSYDHLALVSHVMQ
jgi:hypothetical protein